MSIRKLFVAAILSASTGMAMAQSADINLGDKNARFRYYALIGGSMVGRTEFNLGLLYNEDKNRLADVGFLIVDTAGSKAPGLEVGVGPKATFLWHNDIDAKGVVIELGGRLRYKVPSVQRLLLEAEGYYAPSITSFVDIRNAYELSASIGYELMPRAVAYIGVRRIQASFNKDQGTHTIDKGAHVGIRFSF